MISERTLPTTSIGIVFCVTAVLVTLLIVAVGAGTPAWIGVISGVGLSLSLWVLRWKRWQSVGRFLSSLLAVPVAAGLVAALVGTIVVPATGLFPIESIRAIRTELIGIGTRAVIAGSCVIAAIGVTAAPLDAIDTETTGVYANLLLRVQLFPVAVATLLFAGGTLSMIQPVGPIGNIVDSVTSTIFTPVSERTHIAVFCFMLAVCIIMIAKAIDSLPFSELLPDYRETIGTATTYLSWIGATGMFAVFPAGAIEFGLGQRWVASVFPVPLYNIVVAVTAAPLFRRLIWWALIWCFVAIVLARLLPRVVQGSTDAAGTAVSPYIAGGVVSGVALVTSKPLLSGLFESIPEPAGESIAATFDPVVSQFGPASLVFVIISVLLMLSSVLAGVFWVTLRVRYLSQRTAGATLAASGLFVASSAALTLDIPTLLGMGGLVGAVVVWDAGAFGMTLHTEMGTDTETRRTELVHTGGTLVVGVIGSLLTLGLVGVASGAVSAQPGAALATLVFCLVALISLLVALR
jgi:hypothetical protein